MTVTVSCVVMLTPRATALRVRTSVLIGGAPIALPEGLLHPVKDQTTQATASRHSSLRRRPFAKGSSKSALSGAIPTIRIERRIPAVWLVAAASATKMVTVAALGAEPEMAAG